MADQVQPQQPVQPISQPNIQQVQQQVQQVQQKIEKKEKSEKFGSQLTWVITSFMLGLVGIGTALIMKKVVGDAGPELAAAGMAGGMLQTFVKVGWIVGGVGGIVGLMLLAMLLNTYFKEKGGKKEQPVQPQPTQPAQS